MRLQFADGSMDINAHRVYGSKARNQNNNGLWRTAGRNMAIHTHLFGRAILTRKVGHTDQVFVYNQGSLASLCM